MGESGNVEPIDGEASGDPPKVESLSCHVPLQRVSHITQEVTITIVVTRNNDLLPVHP